MKPETSSVEEQIKQAETMIAEYMTVMKYLADK